MRHDRVPLRESPGPAERYRVDELAARAGMTVRNVRAYQERGLLPPPRREGRVAVYDHAHLARLRIIGRLLERGYSVANIAELLAEWENGRDLASVLGLESAVSRLWPERVPETTTPAELGRLFGDDRVGELVDDLTGAGLVAGTGTRLSTPNPDILTAIATLVRAGVPRDAALELVGRATTVLDGLAESLLTLIGTHVVDTGATSRPGLPDDDAVTRIATAAHGLAPVVGTGLAELFAAMLERHSIAAFGERARPPAPPS
ncbi:MerR HTH family regulatory protein [Pseudonocardia ammonioxydans]|uniref:MerR HTH family regulatory protein n=1 Tax=Pseudonocardia ammonioxydans TaxID=260086 RepID=A0A1I4SFJ4_PSUAM|nr:MerR family transcriptional regulator [Pseudonocardia ammonioxydans]SFM63245.1 MerR HTH family regulatory protein [Pseudonocardia ammonioxydans]